MRPLDKTSVRRILVRGANWVGDAVMTLPAVKALAESCPRAEVHVLAKPWVAPVYQACPEVKNVVLYEAKTRHQGLKGGLALVGELKKGGYDWAVLFQNAFQAALIAFLARIPVRLGYDSDARKMLLTHPVTRTKEDRSVHETSYYLNVLYQLGLIDQAPLPEGVCPELCPLEQDRLWAGDFLAEKGAQGRLLGLAPGAAFGPAKCWPAERFSAAARLLEQDGFETVLLFGSKGEQKACQEVSQGLGDLKTLNLAGATSLGQALALLERLDLFITNDSGLMHAAAALGAPTVAVFGSTNPVTTSAKGPRTALVCKPVDCSPCKKPVCPRDMRCFTVISPEDVALAARGLLAKGPEVMN
ncbi:lipopolysaccharide heptosyltransferase II [Dethiosulfatarculus sandiegensis]|uniref:lipopolysaccharide heptosyltransferase II n=1 Tax=Dethiosulfatarculus sandiegensis TaxID=1429043 RepID=A0A0D2JAZ2_9BACT|nr:lipopolysaccharide heptosyltransferase II [Dethiosulfatarculus sandiegensis]KIX12891.1 ADP-heptose:LPS heptosyltransferase [Dethiosulfatarculus sandiegensis]